MTLILLADDDPDLRQIVEFCLAREGYESISASDGFQALDLIRTRHPDLAILDVMMPRRGGIEVLKEVRADDSYAKMPILMLTARASEDTISQALDAGANDYLTKPFSVAELRARVRTQLR